MRSDVELLEAWRAGDRAAGGALVDRHFAAISRFFRNKVLQPEDADELVSQTFLACTASKERFRGDASVRQYFFAVAHNVLNKYIRGRYKRQRERLDFGSVCVQELDPASPSSVVMHQREARSFVQSLREIPVDDQVVLELMYFEGLSGSEIAELMELPEGTVRGRLARGKERLRERVSEALRGAAGEAGPSVSAGHLEAWAAEVRAQYGW
ncbi:MAG: RNA polymerase sigma factor [Myxococcales bacterium]|nr:RNA polymerase sigma factor [Myxococcales bacterium]